MKLRWILACLSLLFSLTIFAQDFQITIDAQKDAFYNTLTGPEDGHIYVPPDAFIAGNGDMPDDEIDLSALVWSAWDDTYLYFYVEVTDDNVQLNNTTDWQNDCVELKMDPDPTFGATSGICAINLTAMDSLDATGPAAGVGGWSNLDADDNWNGTPNGADDYARELTDLGYNLEFRLTIDSIKTSADGRQLFAEVGSILGAAFNVHENDAVSGGRDGSIQWSAVIDDAVWSNPQLLGQIELLEGHKLAWSPVNAITGVINENDDWYIPPATDVSEKTAVVKNFILSQNYPNPFNPVTTISYTLPRLSDVKISVYDLLGNEVAILVDGMKPAGTYKAQFDGSNLSSGMYFYELQSEGNVISKKMALIK
jgi:hypothetical protein